MKKVLALVVALALVFTTLAGCIVTSAEEAGVALVASDVAVESEAAAKVTVSGTLNADANADYAAIFTITINKDFAFDSIVMGDKTLEKYDEEKANANPDYDFDYAVNVVDGATVIKQLKVLDNTYSFDINLTAPANTTSEDAVYDAVVINAEYADVNAEDPVIEYANATAKVTVLGQKPVEPQGPVLDTRIEQGNSYAAVNDTISLVFLLKHKTVTNAGYDDYKVEFSRNTFTNQYMYNEDLDVQEVEKLTSTSSTAYYQYSGIGMYEMNVPITVTVKCYKNSEYVAYNEFTLNVKDMIIAVYNGANTEESMKSLIVDLLYLGAEAQEYFGTAGTDLATVELPTKDFNVEQTTAFDPDDLTVSESYDVADAYKTLSDFKVTFNLNIAKNPGVYFVIGKLPTSSFAKANITIDTAYTNGLNGSVVPDTVNGANATFAGSRYYYVFNKVAFYDLSQVVTTTVKYNDATVVTINYTVESYIKKNYTDATQGDLLIALAKFSKSARYHFIEKTQA